MKNKEIIEMPGDKGSVIVIMSANYYWNICHSHISDATYYIILNDTDPSSFAQQRIIRFDNKYKPLLTLKEYNYLNLKSLHASKVT